MRAWARAWVEVLLPPRRMVVRSRERFRIEVRWVSRLPGYLAHLQPEERATYMWGRDGWWCEEDGRSVNRWLSERLDAEAL